MNTAAYLLAAQEHDAGGRVTVEEGVWALATIAQDIPATTDRLHLISFLLGWPLTLVDVLLLHNKKTTSLLCTKKAASHGVLYIGVRINKVWCYGFVRTR